MTDRSRLRCTAVADMVMSAEEAAAFIAPGDHVGMSGFTGAGLSEGGARPRWFAGSADAAARGDRFSVGVWTGASTAPELDGALAAVDGIDLRMPYQSDPVTRAKINAGRLDYLDLHLSHVAQMVWEGFFGHLDVALIEVAGDHRRRRADPVLVGRQQQDVDRPGRPGDPRGELVAARRTGGHARHLLRHRAAARTASRSRSCSAVRPDRRALSALPAGEDRRRRAHRPPGPQHAVQAA